MLIVPLIERKRDGGRLTSVEWQALIREYTAGTIPDYQMAALLMAVYLNGLAPDELAALTDAMLHSGALLEFGQLGRPVIDKHSTGGVGDKISLILAPMVACCGVAVPMMSGRGLGHTAGTLDKLETIPGFRTGLSLAEVRRQVERIGCAMFGQTADVAPADRKLYALRDVTATVEAIPLIAASIMSKKLAEGLTGLVLDVKRGSGALLTRLEDSLELARTMIDLGEAHGCPTIALLTAMDRPLGVACGNALETREAIRALHGEGPADLMEVTYALGVEMLLLARVERSRNAARKRLESAIAAGDAARRFGQVIAAQGGDPAVLDDGDLLPRAARTETLVAEQSGVVVSIEPRAIGRAIVAMGGGRQKVDDVLDLAAGFEIALKPGDKVEKGQPLAVIHARDDLTLGIGRDALRMAIRIGRRAPRPLPLVSHRVTRSAVESL